MNTTGTATISTEDASIIRSAAFAMQSYTSTFGLRGRALRDQEGKNRDARAALRDLYDSIGIEAQETYISLRGADPATPLVQRVLDEEIVDEADRKCVTALMVFSTMERDFEARR
jgi:hypothetical protein